MREETRKIARRALKQTERAIGAVPTSPDGGATEMKNLRYAVQSLFEVLFDIVEEEPEVIDLNESLPALPDHGVGRIITDVDELLTFPRGTVFTANVDDQVWQRVYGTAVGTIGVTRYYDLTRKLDANSVSVSAPFTIRYVPEPTA